MRNESGLLSPGTLIGVAALVLALAGTSVAAQGIGKNSVGAKELGKVKPRSASVVIDPGETGEAVAQCKRGEQLLGGGATFSGVTAEESADIDLSYPEGGKAWAGGGYNGDGDPRELLVTALCLKK
jgi:hypothetical protein